MGPGIEQGAAEVKRCTISNNVINGTGVTASPPSYAAGIYLDAKNEEVNITNNVIENTAMGGIQQDTVLTYAYLKRCTISNNTIRTTKKHGVYIAWADGFTINGNNISAPNGASGAFDGINFDSASVYIVQNGTISNNTIAGGRYSIYQPRTDAGYLRTMLFSGNMSIGATTAPYLIYGRLNQNVRSDGVLPAVVQTGSAGSLHIPTTGAISQILLDPGAAATIIRIDGGAAGNIITIFFYRADTLMKNDGTYLRLAGHSDVTPTAGSTITFMCTLDTDPANNYWQEVSRSIY